MSNAAGQSYQQTLQQQRAYAAWHAVNNFVNGLDPDGQKKYASLVRGAPATILRDGFAPALAFLGKGKQIEQGVIQHLTNWMRSQLKFKQATLIEYLVECTSAEYRRATTEALAYLMWLKRFAEALDKD